MSAARRNLARVCLLSALLIPILAACGGRAETPMTVPAGARPETLIDLHECTYTALKVPYAADCGTLIVPQNRNDPSSSLIVAYTFWRAQRSAEPHGGAALFPSTRILPAEHT